MIEAPHANLDGREPPPQPTLEGFLSYEARLEVARAEFGPVIRGEVEPGKGYAISQAESDANVRAAIAAVGLPLERTLDEAEARRRVAMREWEARWGGERRRRARRAGRQARPGRDGGRRSEDRSGDAGEGAGGDHAQPPSAPSPPLSQRQAARKLRISERRVRAAVRNGELPASKPGERTVYIKLGDLWEWWERSLRVQTWRTPSASDSTRSGRVRALDERRNERSDRAALPGLKQAPPNSREGPRLMSRRRDRRNLTKRGGVWYVDAVVDGRRVKRSLKTSKLEVARERRDAVLREALADRCEPEAEPAPAPTFAEVATTALEFHEGELDAGVEHAYASSTLKRWKGALREGGPILAHLGALPIVDVDAPALRRWWDAALVGKLKGKNELDAVRMAFTHARERGVVAESRDPVAGLSRQLGKHKRRRGAKAAREETRRLAKAGRLRPEEFGRLTKAAREDRHPEALALVLLLGEAGLRLGEAMGLQWGDAVGAGPDDPRRHLHVRHSLSPGLKGLELGPVKSGKARRVPVSRRLWLALEALRSRAERGRVVSLEGERQADGRPSPFVLSMDYYNASNLYLKRVREAAGLARVTPQNLRSTASTLLKEWGVPEKLVRASIGHGDDGVAEAHYDAVDPTEAPPPQRWDRDAGENFADLFERLCPEPDESHTTSHTTSQARARKSPETRPAGWRSQGESNPCLSLERAAS